MSPFVQEDCTEVMQMCASAGCSVGIWFDLELKIGEHSIFYIHLKVMKRYLPVREKRLSREPDPVERSQASVYASAACHLPTVILWEKMRFIWIPLLSFVLRYFQPADGCI